MKKERIIEIDIAKGIGSILVILGHMLGVTSFGGTVIYSFHIPMFFILSGVVSKETRESNLRCIICSQAKLIFNYLFWSILYIVFDFVVRYLIIKTSNIRLIIRDMYETIVLYGINVLWFISTIVIAKILVYFCVQLTKYNYIRLLITIIFYFGVAFCSEYVKEFFSDSTWLYYIVVTVLRAFLMTVFIEIGIICGPYIKILTKKLAGYAMGGGILTGITIYIFAAYLYENKYFVDFHELRIGNALVVLFTSIAGFVMVISISTLISKTKYMMKYCSFLGKNSLFIMVTHEYFMIREEVTSLILSVFYPIANWISLLMILAFILVIETILIYSIMPYINKIEKICIAYLMDL